MKTIDEQRLSPDYLYDDVNPHVQSAFEHFAGISGPRGAAKLNPDIQDSDGLVSYIVVSANEPGEPIKSLYEELQPVMEGLTNVVVSAVIKTAAGSAEKKHDPATWRAPLQAMIKAFCSGFSQTTRSYDQTVRGVEVATKFINILLDATASQGAALANFTRYLQAQGETIRVEMAAGQNSYLYAVVSIVHEIFQAKDGTWIYVPKFKSYFTRFSRETLKITSSCASFEDFHFKFDLDIMTGAFMVSSWQNRPAFRQAVNDFIDQFQEANIKDSTNFFKDVFKSALRGT